MWLIFSYVSTYLLLSFEGGECGSFFTFVHIFCLKEEIVAHFSCLSTYFCLREGIVTHFTYLSTLFFFNFFI